MHQGLKMLHLNVDTDITCGFEANNCFSSGASVSSGVLYADEAEPLVDDSVSYSATDKLGQKRKSKENSHSHQSSDDLITKQLFPVAGDVEAEESSSGLITSRPSMISFVTADWLNLKVPESASMPKNTQMVPPLKSWKSRRGPPSKSSPYRGVTFYRRTARWEAHIWDCGKQVYIGGFDTSYAAARAYDQAAIKFRGTGADINFDLSDYEEDMKQVRNLSKEEFIKILRRHSNGFSRRTSEYQGVTLHKKAYDKAVRSIGREAITNFEQSTFGYGVGVNWKGKDEDTNGYNLDLNLDIGMTKETAIGFGVSNTSSQMQSTIGHNVAFASTAASSGFSSYQIQSRSDQSVKYLSWGKNLN